MANIGNLIANNYLIPQQQYGGQNPAVQPQGTSTQVPDFGIPETPAGLAYIQGIDNDTRSFYDKWAKVKQFAQTMYGKYGIDVTKPDFNNEASFKANEIFNKALADLQFQGDQLQQSKVRNEQLFNLQAEGKTTLNQDLTSGYSSMQDPRALSTSTQQFGLAEELNKRMQQDYKTPREFQEAMSLYTEGVERLKQLKQEDPANADEWGRQLTMLNKPVQGSYAPRDLSSGKAKTASAARNAKASGELITKVSHVMTGAGDGWAVSDAEGTNANLLENDSLTGIEYGNKVIDRAYHDPTTGKTFLIFTDNSELDLTKEDAYGVASTIISNNPKFGSKEDLDLFIDSLEDEEGNKIDPFVEGRIVPEFFVKEDALSKRQSSYSEAKQAREFITTTGTQALSSKLLDAKKGDVLSFDTSSDAKVNFKANTLYIGGPEERTFSLEDMNQFLPDGVKESDRSGVKKTAIQNAYGIKDISEMTIDEVMVLLNAVGSPFAEYKKNKKTLTSPKPAPGEPNTPKPLFN